MGDLAELPVLVIWQSCLSVDSALPVADLAKLPVCGRAFQGFGRIACMWRSVLLIWQQNCLSVDTVPVIWQNCLYVGERESARFAELQCCASDLAELSVCGQYCASDLAELPVCGGACQ